jgi:hypothetical protein
MKINDYYNTLQRFRDLLSAQVTKLISDYGQHLTIRLGDYNILQREGNCLESATAIGYILEEFFVAKLEGLTHNNPKGYRLFSYSDGTATRSCDCYATFNNLKILINLKTEKKGSTNNAVAAINRLAKDYCDNDEDNLAYLILKISYDYSDNDGERSLHLNKTPFLLFLEECDFSRGHQQDKRRWSTSDPAKKRENNGRLILSRRFINDHPMPLDSISHSLTKKQLSLLNTIKGYDEDYIMPPNAWPKST